jgi:hypothetical protein
MVAETWFTALPQTLPRSRRLGALRNRFGAAGPWAFVVILALTTEQLYATNRKLRASREAGLVSVGWDELAYLVAASVEEVREIVVRMAALEPPLVVIRSQDDLGATLVLPEWDRWHPGPKDPEAAERQRRHRHKLREQAVRDGSQPAQGDLGRDTAA